MQAAAAAEQAKQRQKIANEAAGFGALTDDQVVDKILSDAQAGAWTPKDAAHAQSAVVMAAITRAAAGAGAGDFVALVAILCTWSHPITAAALEAVLSLPADKLQLLKDKGVPFESLVVSSADGLNAMDLAVQRGKTGARDLLLTWNVYGTTDTTSNEGLFRSAAKAGDTALMTTLKGEPHSCDVQAAGTDGLNAMDLAIKINATGAVGLLLQWHVRVAGTEPLATLGNIVAMVTPSTEMIPSTELIPSMTSNAQPTPPYLHTYAASLLIHVDCEATDTSNAKAPFSPIATRPGGVWLKQQWGRLDNADTARADWETMYAISQRYLDGCIEAATPQDQSALLQATYSEMRDQHKGMYKSTMASVKRDTNFATYSGVLSGVDSRVGLRYSANPAVQRSDQLWDVYCDARAIQHRYEQFMRVLSEKTGCNYTAGKRKNPYRAIEKLGLALHQWHASTVKDIVRGAQVMPDVGKGLQLLELLVACDPSEADDSTKRGWNAQTAGIQEQICIVGVKDRWVKATSGGWSDALLTFYFLDDPSKHIWEVQLVHADMMRVRKQMGAHKGYSAFRCALELLEATAHADLITAIESQTEDGDGGEGAAKKVGADAGNAAVDSASNPSDGVFATTAALASMEARFEARLNAYESQINALQQEVRELKELGSR